MKKSIAPEEKKPECSGKHATPVINVELEPVFEVVTPAPDMESIAKAIESIMLPKPQVEAHFHEPEEKSKVGRQIEFEVTERDSRGLLKKFICTVINDG